MTNRETMLIELKKHTVPYILEKGFKGKYPDFKREHNDCVELISFVTSKYGGSFYIETSVAFPHRKNKNYFLISDEKEEFSVFSTDKRYRLPGMFDGEFYYSDVYKSHIKINPFKRATVYEAVLNREKSPEYIKNGYKCVQYFNKNTAEQICTEINKQLDKAFLWMKKFEKANR